MLPSCSPFSSSAAISTKRARLSTDASSPFEKASFVPGMTIPALRWLRLAGRGFFRLGREGLDLRARIFLGHPNVVERLQIHPELRARAEPVCETKSGIAGNRALTVDDLADAVRGHPDLPRELGRADAEFFKFVGENFAGVDRCAGHGQSPFSGSPQFRRSKVRSAPQAIRNRSAIAY